MVTERKITRWKNKYCLAKYTLSNAGIEKMMELMSLTDKIAKEGRSSRRSIWVNVPNKTDNGDWVNIRFCGAVYGPGDMTQTLWWALVQDNKKIEDLTPEQLIVLKRIQNEPASIMP